MTLHFYSKVTEGKNSKGNAFLLMDLHENLYWSNTPGSMEVHVIMKKFGLPVNYARHARGNAGNGANIDKHHRQGIFRGVPLGTRRRKYIYNAYMIYQIEP